MLALGAIASSSLLVPSPSAPMLLPPAGRDVFFYTDVSAESSVQLQHALRDAYYDEDASRVDLHVQSGGGSLLTGLHLYDALLRAPKPVHTHIEGMAASSATLLTLAGAHRTITKHSVMLVHEPSLPTHDGAARPADASDVAANLQRCLDALVEVYEERTGLRRRDVRALLANERYLSASDCLRYGFVDEIV